MPKESINESIFSAISHRGFGTALSELIPTAENNAKHKQSGVLHKGDETPKWPSNRD
jgi:hypothetical protein